MEIFRPRGSLRPRLHRRFSDGRLPGVPPQSRELKMHSARPSILLLLALLILCFGLAADLQPQFRGLSLSRADGDIFAVVLGDSRRMFANEFYVTADAYYH